MLASIKSDKIKRNRNRIVSQVPLFGNIYTKVHIILFELSRSTIRILVFYLINLNSRLYLKRIDVKSLGLTKRGYKQDKMGLYWCNPLYFHLIPLFFFLSNLGKIG